MLFYSSILALIADITSDALSIQTKDVQSCSGAGSFRVVCKVDTANPFSCCHIKASVGGEVRPCAYTSMNSCDVAYSEDDCYSSKTISVTPVTCMAQGKSTLVKLDYGQQVKSLHCQSIVIQTHKFCPLIPPVSTGDIHEPTHECNLLSITRVVFLPVKRYSYPDCISVWSMGYFVVFGTLPPYGVYELNRLSDIDNVYSKWKLCAVLTKLQFIS